jgi:hypothetical protein
MGRQIRLGVISAFRHPATPARDLDHREDCAAAIGRSSHPLGAGPALALVGSP